MNLLLFKLACDFANIDLCICVKYTERCFNFDIVGLHISLLKLKHIVMETKIKVVQVVLLHFE